MISNGAVSPCTWHGEIKKRMRPRRSAMRRMSRTAAPVGDVTMPTRRGHGGSGRLRLAIEQPLGRPASS